MDGTYTSVQRAESARSWLVAALLAGLALRLTVAPFGDYVADSQDMAAWAVRLVTAPLPDFYAAPMTIDHLPGDMWIMLGLGHFYHLFSPSMNVQLPIFTFLLKSVPALADVGIGLMLYLMGRHFAGPGVGLIAACFYLFNPASIFLTGIWGQWDSVSGFVVLTALWLLLRGNAEWSFPLLVYAALIKPPLAALIPLFGLVFLRRTILPAWQDARQPGSHMPALRALRPVLIAVIGSLAVLFAVTLPFNVGVPPFSMRWSLAERITTSLNLFNGTTLDAFTLWGTPLSANWRPDSQPFLLGLSYQRWGTMLYALAYLLILARYWRSESDRAVLWACVAITFCSFMLPTRIHERYLFPTFALMALAGAVVPRLQWPFIGLSVSFLFNLYFAYDLFYPALELHVLYSSDTFIHLMSLLNVALLLYVLIWGLPVILRSPLRKIVMPQRAPEPG